MTATNAVEEELIAILPIEASMSGRNSVYQFCDARQQQVSYAVCLHTIKKIQDDSIPRDQFVECQRAYCHNNCPSAKMRAQEVAAGQALFFIPRRLEITDPVAAKNIKNDGAVSSGKYDMQNASYARGWAIGGGDGEVRDRAAPKRRVPPPAVKKSGFVEMDLAQVVNAISDDDKKKAAQGPVAQGPAIKCNPETVAAAKEIIGKRDAAAVLEKATEIVAANPTMRPLPGESMADFLKRRALMSKAK